MPAYASAANRLSDAVPDERVRHSEPEKRRVGPLSVVHTGRVKERLLAISARFVMINVAQSARLPNSIRSHRPCQRIPEERTRFGIRSPVVAGISPAAAKYPGGVAQSPDQPRLRMIPTHVRMCRA
jgi:hypothetical protein